MISLPQKTEGRWVFGAGFLTPASALEGACKLTLKLHAVYPWKSAASTPPDPAAPAGRTGSVLFPFCFYVARFPPNPGQFCFLRGACCPDQVLPLCLPVQGEVKASLPQSPWQGWEVWREHVLWCFPLGCDCRLCYSTKRSFLFRGISF